MIGTPLDPKDEKTDGASSGSTSKYLPVWKQEVTDERGRKRFHGAFTGGFSAGFFNTVGSKEGWAPSTFKSTRAAKAEIKQTSAQDYMDEEDINNMAKELTTKPEYDLFGGTASVVQTPTSNVDTPMSLFEGVFKDIIEPNRDPIGMRLLKKMGWTEGQTRVVTKVYKIKKRQTTRIVDSDDFGAFDRPAAGDDEEDQEELTRVEYGKEYPTVQEYAHKNDTYGVGYEASEEVRRMRGDSTSSATNTMRFGRDDAADGNVYGVDSKDEYDRVIGGSRQSSARQQGGPSRQQQEIIDFLKPKDDSARARRCSDGSVPLRNFIVSSHSKLQVKWYEPPVVPPGFDLKHRYSAPLDVNILQRPANIVTVITPLQRSLLLNERVLPSAPKPVASKEQMVAKYGVPATTTNKPTVPPDALKAMQQAFANRFVSADDGRQGQPQKAAPTRSKPIRKVADWYPELIDLYDVDSGRYNPLFKKEPREFIKFMNLHQSLALCRLEEHNSDLPSIVPTFELFNILFDTFTRSSLAHIQWDKNNDDVQIVVAGGSITACLTPDIRTIEEYVMMRAIVRTINQLPLSIVIRRQIIGYITPLYVDAIAYTFASHIEYLYRDSDIDIFVISKSLDLALNRMESLVQEIALSVDNAKLVRTPNTVTIYDGYGKHRPIQIITSVYRSIDELLLSFDLDCVCVAFDGQRLRGLPRTTVSYNYRINMMVPRTSRLRGKRATKYNHRGFRPLSLNPCGSYNSHDEYGISPDNETTSGLYFTGPSCLYTDGDSQGISG
eukprot:gene10202-11884_t